MRRQLPALNALRSFEAVARLASFSRAAEELGVTPAAVSHQVKVLEEQLGQRLLERTSRKVKPTAAGTALSQSVAEALDGMAAAVRRVKGRPSEQRLLVTTSPSFGSKWLVPRLESFARQHPDADVRIDVSSEVVVLGQDVDIALRFGAGAYPGLMSERLFDEVISPVCSPRLLRRGPALETPEDLRQHTLIHYDWQMEGAVWPDWHTWLLAAGVEGIDTTRGLHFTSSNMALQAAIDGQGVALGDSTLVADDLSARRLVHPFDLSLRAPLGFAYHLVYPQSALEKPLVRAFRDWVLAGTAQTKKRQSRRAARKGKGEKQRV